MNLNTMFPVVQTSMLSPAEGESENQNTGFAVVNLSNRTATLTFSGYDRSGVLVSGADITNSKSVSLRGGANVFSPFPDFRLRIGREELAWLCEPG